MGTWGVSKAELISKLTDRLDNIEGDFDNKTLLEALDFMRFYCPTSDSTSQHEELWKKKLQELEN